MKRIAIFIVCSILSFTSFAQESKADTIAPYLKSQDMPSFPIRLMDSVTKFNTRDIKPGKTTMFILFGADCSHCKVFTDSFTRHIDKFADVDIYMLTFSPFSDLRKFADSFKLTRYKNIVIGQDNEFFFPYYYKVSSVPDIAIYNKKRKFVKLFTGDIKIDELEAATKL